MAAGFGLVVLLAVLVVPLLVVGAVVALVLARSRTPDAHLTTELASARRHAASTWALSALVLALLPLVVILLAVGSVALGLTAVPGRLVSQALACLPLAGAAAALLVLLAGELTWPRPTGTSRTALLHDRSTGMVLGGRWVRAGVALTVLLTAALVTGGIVADGTAGSVTRTFPGGSRSAGPFPGWLYTGPQLGALALCLLLAALTLRATVRRSAVVTAEPGTDLVLRRASVARACRVLVAAGLVTLGADLLLGAAAASHVYPGGTAHGVAQGLLLLGPALLVAGLVTLAVPVPRLTGTVPHADPSMSTLSA